MGFRIFVSNVRWQLKLPSAKLNEKEYGNLLFESQENHRIIDSMTRNHLYFTYFLIVAVIFNFALITAAFFFDPTFEYDFIPYIYITIPCLGCALFIAIIELKGFLHLQISIFQKGVRIVGYRGLNNPFYNITLTFHFDDINGLKVGDGNLWLHRKGISREFGPLPMKPETIQRLNDAHRDHYLYRPTEDLLPESI